MLVLRKGDRGDAVRALQNDLHGKGIRITADAIFGFKTEVAVKEFQRKNGLHPDGIVGRHTLAALGKPVTSRPPHPAIGGVAGRQGVGAMKLSISGADFLYRHEASPGVSNHLYWPKGASGVTLGAGYDMRHRSAAEIKDMIVKIGIDEDIAIKVAEASGLYSNEAKEFAHQNHSLLNLTREQETKLFQLTFGSYVSQVQRGVFVPLKQYEFDALVSFTYNPGGRRNNVYRLINSSNISDAMDEIKKAIKSKGEILNGLVNRRNDEVKLFLYGEYK